MKFGSYIFTSFQMTSPWNLDSYFQTHIRDPFFKAYHSKYHECEKKISWQSLLKNKIWKSWWHHSPPGDMHLIFEISSLKNQVWRTEFFVYFKLDFCRLHRQKNQVRRGAQNGVQFTFKFLEYKFWFSTLWSTQRSAQWIRMHFVIVALLGLTTQYIHIY